MPCETMNNRPSNPTLSRVRPLALALALAFAGDASLAGAAMATHAAPVGSRAGGQPAAPKSAPSPRPDGSVLWSVDNCDDAGTGSLRDVAAHANHGDGIDLGGLTCGTISVTTGAITLRDVELTGPGAEQLAIDGAANQGKRIFNHASGGGTLDISGVTIKGGTYVSNASLGGGCLRSDGGNLRVSDSVFKSCLVFTPAGQAGSARGGAIAFYGDGDVRLYDTTIESSLAQTDHEFADGGGLHVDGRGLLLMQRSTITHNSASKVVVGSSGGTSGGGLDTLGSVWIEDSTLSGNTSTRDAGAAWVGGGGMLLNSTVSNNASAGTPGIVFLDIDHTNAATAIYSSTISGNVSEQSTQWLSGGLYLGTVTAVITNCTITGNRETNQAHAKFGAGIIFGEHVVNAVMSGTIVAGNYFDAGEMSHTDDDISGPDTLTILGDTNIVGWSGRPVPADTIWASDPKLGPLQDNGGPTWTHMPLPDSPAIDQGAAHGFDTDQRGYARVVGAAADIGAVESDNDTIFANGFELP